MVITDKIVFIGRQWFVRNYFRVFICAYKGYSISMRTDKEATVLAISCLFVLFCQDFYSPSIMSLPHAHKTIRIMKQNSESIFLKKECPTSEIGFEFHP